MTTKRVVIATFGSYGDIHPFMALALALQRRGLQPVIATMAEYKERIESAGIAFAAVRPSIADLTGEAPGGEARLARDFAKGGLPFLMERVIGPWLPHSLADLERVADGAALIVGSSFSVVARIAAERLHMPLVSVLLSPMLHYSAHEPIHTQEAPWLPAFQRRFGPRLTRRVLDLGRWRMRRHQRSIGAFRDRMGLLALPGDALIDGALAADLVACLYSPLLGQLPPDAAPTAWIAGHSFFDGAEGMSAGLSAFFDAGEPPVVFSLGSFAAFMGERFYTASAQAARRIGRRAVLLVGAGEEAAVASRVGADDQVHVAGYVPHSLAFPRAAAVVHHGGIGTSGQALRGGRPQLVCPFWGDQFDNAERLVRLGVARRLDHRRYSADRAAAALSALLDPATDYSDRAGEAGVVIAEEDGPAALATRVAAMLS